VNFHKALTMHNFAARSEPNRMDARAASKVGQNVNVEQRRWQILAVRPSNTTLKRVLSH
jgi:hypothetical protein